MNYLRATHKLLEENRLHIGISRPTRQILTTIATGSDTVGSRQLSYDAIAQKTGYSRRQVSYSIKELKELDIIVQIKNRTTAAVYSLSKEFMKLLAMYSKFVYKWGIQSYEVAREKVRDMIDKGTNRLKLAGAKIASVSNEIKRKNLKTSSKSSSKALLDIYIAAEREKEKETAAADYFYANEVKNEQFTAAAFCPSDEHKTIAKKREMTSEQFSNVLKKFVQFAISKGYDKLTCNYKFGEWLDREKLSPREDSPKRWQTETARVNPTAYRDYIKPEEVERCSPEEHKRWMDDIMGRLTGKRPSVSARGEPIDDENVFGNG
jgi:DNA-binding transcriptional regulator GbsR (MarR family)